MAKIDKTLKNPLFSFHYLHKYDGKNPQFKMGFVNPPDHCAPCFVENLEILFGATFCTGYHKGQSYFIIYLKCVQQI